MEQKAKEKAKDSRSPTTSPVNGGWRSDQLTEAVGPRRAEAAAKESPQAPSEEQELGGFASPTSRTDDDLVDVAPLCEG